MSDRKYGSRGYMQGDREEPRREQPSGAGSRPREKPDGPRGRGLGAPTESVFRCAVCGAKQEAPAVGALAATCRQCGTDLHACSQCRHFDTSVHNECRKQVPVRIAKKTQRNECALFEPKLAQVFAAESGRPSDAKSAFDALFKL